MSFDAAGGAEAIKTLLEGLTGISGAQIGVPESIGPRVYGYVTAGSFALLVQTEGSIQRDLRYTATLAYRVGRDESAAETALMSLLDQLLGALKIGSMLQGAGRIMDVDTSLADMPEYIARAANEYREFPIVITIRQNHVYT